MNGVIWLYVNDGVVTASNNEILKRLETDLKDLLQIKWEHSLTSIVGLEHQGTIHGSSLSSTIAYVCSIFG